MELKLKEICIVGVGLIGGSVGLALKEVLPDVKVIGFGRDLDRLKLARDKGCIDEFSLDLKEAVKNSDIVVVSTPVEIISDLVIDILPYVKRDCVIIDVGSVKFEIIRKVSKYIKIYKRHKNVNFVGCHPIAGSEKSGFEFSNKDLFKNSVCVICYCRELATKQAYQKIKKFWEILKAKTINLEPKEHDKILSTTSHFLHVLSYLIVNYISKNKNYINFTGGAYRDMSRIAASLPQLWAQICFMNRKFLIKDIDNFINMLNEVKGLIDNKQRLYKVFLKAYKIKNSELTKK